MTENLFIYLFSSFWNNNTIVQYNTAIWNNSYFYLFIYCDQFWRFQVIGAVLAWLVAVGRYQEGRRVD